MVTVVSGTKCKTLLNIFISEKRRRERKRKKRKGDKKQQQIVFVSRLVTPSTIGELE